MRLVALAVIAAAAAPPATYREAAQGVEIRVRGALATVTYAHPGCGLRTVRKVPVRRSRFRLKTSEYCGTATSTVVVTGRITPRRVTGRVGAAPFVARRNAAPPTRAQRCALRGTTLAQTPLVRVFDEGNRTLACRLADGFAVEIAETVWDEDRYYSAGIAARHVVAVGSRIAYARVPFDSARSKFGQDPGFEDDVIVHDLANGARRSVHPDLFSVTGLAMRDDGAVAWAGSKPSESPDVLVQTAQDGQIVTLDRGRIDPASLRVVDGAFVWTKNP